jgi:hypothetical protein
VSTDSGFGVAGVVARLIAMLLRLSGSISGYVEDRAAAIRAAWYQELRRSAATLIYALVGAFFICSAAAWCAFALMLAFWDTHRVLVASLVATAFLLLAVLVLLLLRRGTR